MASPNVSVYADRWGVARWRTCCTCTASWSCREMIQDMEHMMRADLEESSHERDAAWDVQSLRREYGRTAD